MSINMDKEYRIAFSEVDDILYFADNKLVSKVPKSFINFIRENKDENYISNINPYISFEAQNISEKARAIIALIYESYIATAEEKKQFMEKANIEFENIEKKKREKYNPDKIFDNKDTPKIVPNGAELEEKSLVLKNESLIEKVVNFIKKLFKVKD